MKKQQYLALLAAAVLFLGLYLGFDTKPSGQHKIEQSRAIQGEATSFETILADAREHLGETERVAAEELDKKFDAATNDTERAEALKQLSGFWYRTGNRAVAGGFAEKVAEIESTDAAWSVAGATYFQALQASDNPILRQYCAGRAVKAFESAASLAPDDPEHRVNIALVHAEQPSADNPMQAVLLLRELEAKYPNEPAVYNALGRLAIKTGQWERALQRLEKAYQLDPANPNTPCLLAKAYEGAGNTAKAEEFADLCQKANRSPEQ